MDGRLLIRMGTPTGIVELASGREYRSFVQQSQVEKGLYWNVAVRPQAAWLLSP